MFSRPIHKHNIWGRTGPGSVVNGFFGINEWFTYLLLYLLLEGESSSNSSHRLYSVPVHVYKYITFYLIFDDIFSSDKLCFCVVICIASKHKPLTLQKKFFHLKFDVSKFKENSFPLLFFLVKSPSFTIFPL